MMCSERCEVRTWPAGVRLISPVMPMCCWNLLMGRGDEVNANTTPAVGSLFSGTGPVSCEDACDADDTGELTVADPIYMLEDLFQDGPDPSGPYPACGLDPTDDMLGCDTYNACP